MEPEQQVAGPGEDEHRTTAVRVRRALARRFPRTRWLYNWIRIQIPHYVRRLLQALRPRAALATLRYARELWRTVRSRAKEPRLTVGVDVTALWEPLTGVGWYLYRLLEALAERDDVVVNLYGPTVIDSPDRVEPHVTLPEGPAMGQVLHEVPDDLALSRGFLIRLLRKLEPFLIAADGNDVLFGPNYFLPRRFTFARGARVVTVHDLGFRTVPWTLQEETLRELTAKLERSITEADQVLTVSAAIRDETTRYGYASPERLHVVHHGPGHLSEVEASNLPAGAPERYALHVGTLEPRKNVVMLLEAWQLLRQMRPNAPDLLFCGRLGWKAEAIAEAMDQGKQEGWVHHPGYVSEGELAALYQRAELVVFPSLYEGFGLPAVEAFWAGTPLVCSDIAALREVAGEAALYAPADRPDLFAEQVARLLDSPEVRAELAEAGRRRAASLSWGTSAEKTLRVWNLAAHRPSAAEPGS